MSPQKRSVFFKCKSYGIFYSLKLVCLFSLICFNRTSFAYFYYVIESESDYMVEIMIEPFEACDDSADCMVKLKYHISLVGDEVPDSLYSLSIKWVYNEETIDILLPRVAGSGSVKCFYGYLVDGDCREAPKVDFGEVEFDLWISAPGILEQTVDWTQVFIHPLLIRFDVDENDDNVMLEWELAYELDNDYYSIERSINGITWQMLDSIQSFGNNSENVIYQLVDKSPYYGISYYRLKRTDNNGVKACMGTESIVVETEANELFVYPNPTSNGFTVIGKNIKGAKIVLVDMSNRTVAEFESQFDQPFFVPTEGVPKGSYILKIEQNSRLMQEHVIIY